MCGCSICDSPRLMTRCVCMCVFVCGSVGTRKALELKETFHDTLREATKIPTQICSIIQCYMKNQVVLREVAENVAKDMGGLYYLEVDARLERSSNECFLNAIQVALENKKKRFRSRTPPRGGGLCYYMYT